MWVLIQDDLEYLENGYQTLSAMLRDSNVPLIFICNSYDDPKLWIIASSCHKVEFKFPHENVIFNWVR